MITYLSRIDPGPISNQGYTHERSIDVEIERDSDRRHVNGTGGLASFVNPAFDKDDIADEHLDSSMARPNANRPGTLRKLLFCNQLRYGKICRDNCIIYFTSVKGTAVLFNSWEKHFSLSKTSSF